MMASTPALSAAWVRAMLSAVLFEPVPAMISRSPPTASVMLAKSLTFSSKLRVGLSPVVPLNTTPSEPFSASRLASLIACS